MDCEFQSGTPKSKAKTSTISWAIYINLYALNSEASLIRKKGVDAYELVPSGVRRYELCSKNQDFLASSVKAMIADLDLVV
jgi:hypothetical protein